MSTLADTRHRAGEQPVNSKQGLFDKFLGKRTKTPQPTAVSVTPEPVSAPQVLPVPASRVEVVEHYTPAQLDPRPVLAAIVKDCTDALSGTTSPQAALLKVRNHEQALDFRLTQARRQAANRVEAAALAEAAEAANRVGLVPPRDTLEFDRLAAQNAATMARRALHASAPEEATGVIPVVRLGDELPPPAASPTGFVADKDEVVHRQYPGVHLAFPACGSWELFRQAQANEVGFLPTKRELSCTREACAEQCEEPRVLAAAEPASPVHAPDDGSHAPVPLATAELKPLPRRVPRVTAIAAPVGRDGGPLHGERVDPREADIAGAWVFFGNAGGSGPVYRQVETVKVDEDAVRIAFRNGDTQTIKRDAKTQTVRVLSAAEASELLAQYADAEPGEQS